MEIKISIKWLKRSSFFCLPWTEVVNVHNKGLSRYQNAKSINFHHLFKWTKTFYERILLHTCKLNNIMIKKCVKGDNVLTLWTIQCLLLAFFLLIFTTIISQIHLNTSLNIYSNKKLNVFNCWCKKERKEGSERLWDGNFHSFSLFLFN